MFGPSPQVALLGTVLVLAGCLLSSTQPARPARALLTPLNQVSVRDAYELAEERAQVLAAQQSIASWRERLRRPPQEAEEDSLQRSPNRRRKKRADRNAVPAAVAPPAKPENATTVPEPDDGDDPEASVVCYGPLGCFHETDHLPEMLPSSPAEVNTRFLVYTTTHRSEKPLVEFSYEELVVAGFGAAYWANGTNDTTSIPAPTGASSPLLQTFGDLGNRTVRVIVHGFGANCGLVWIYEMRTALMAVENCTVLCVDWENGAKLPNYVRAAANTRLVGRQLALLLRLLRTHNGLQLSRVHLIGFSLGSHVAGFAGAEFAGAPVPADDGPATTEPPAPAGLWRITGLDPAGPLFEAQPPEVRLDAGDARYVDVIHSNGENLILGGLGSWQPMGTVDYYPNGGRVQHGCTNLFVGAVTDIIWAPPTTVEGRSLCNHRRAYKFFIDSVAPRCHFPAFPCESYDQFAAGECFDCGANGTSSACGHMGYYATSRDVGGYGQLYLRTRDEEPYCANQFRLRLRNAPDELPLRTVGRFELTLEGGDTGNGIEDGPGAAGGAAAGAAAALLTFNETFHLDEAREDREFHAGQWLTTILVPHPALGHRPRALTITYRPYRGGWWQRSSVGKQLWRIGPILLTADDQRTYGSCGTLTLQADVPVRIELKPVLVTSTHVGDNDDDGDDGEDDDGDDDDIECRAAEETHPGTRGPAQPSAAPPKSSIDELVSPGAHPAAGGHDHFSWTPVAISIPRLHSPSAQPAHANEKRSFSDADAAGFGAEPAQPVPPTAQTVQLFPSRLVSFFERAERYARRTWDALFSGNATDATAPKMAPVDGDDTTVPSVVDLLLAGPGVTTTTSSPAITTSTSTSTTTTTGSSASEPSSTEIRIALPTFRPLTRQADGSVGSGRQHYTRFIPLVYEEQSGGGKPAAVTAANARKAR